MKTLIIAEKPSVARDIVGALPGSFDEHKNFYESDDYVVSFAVGHLLELSDPEDYDPAWKSWKLDNLPIIPEEFKVRPRDKKSATQLNLIHKLLKRKDVDRVVNACDAGREGELIFTHIY
jgi:DNA topoisomerase III